MKVVEGSIVDVAKSGVIAHQVNCQNAMGSGVARVLFERYPDVKSEYHKFCDEVGDSKKLLGKVQLVQVADSLFVANVFTQEFFGNAYVDGICYTDEVLLVERLVELCHVFSDREVYVPERIGCGLAGGDWGKVFKMLQDAELENLVIVSFSE